MALKYEIPVTKEVRATISIKWPPDIRQLERQRKVFNATMDMIVGMAENELRQPKRYSENWYCGA